MTRWTGPLHSGQDGVRHPHCPAADCYETESGKKSWMNRRRIHRLHYHKKEYSFLASKRCFQFTLQWQKSYFQTLSGNILEVKSQSLLTRQKLYSDIPPHKHTHHHWEGQADDVDGPDRAEACQNSPYEIIIGFGSISSSVSGSAGLSSERWSRWPRKAQWPGAAAQPGAPVRMCVVGFDVLLTRRRRSGRTAVDRSRANTVTWRDGKRHKREKVRQYIRLHFSFFLEEVIVLFFF